jgi:hypothetical protein
VLEFPSVLALALSTTDTTDNANPIITIIVKYDLFNNN